MKTNIPPGKRLALFFDGTWNTPESRTNVSEFYQLVSVTGADGVPQWKFYDPGVGTHWYHAPGDAKEEGSDRSRGLAGHEPTSHRPWRA